jgi:hypothetical protein
MAYGEDDRETRARSSDANAGTGTGTGGDYKDHSDYRSFEHGYNSAYGSTRSQDYQDSLRDAFRNAGWSDRKASALSADLANADYLDRAKRYGIIDGIAGRSAWSQALSGLANAGLAMTPLGGLLGIGDLAQQGLTSGFGTLRGNQIGGVVGGLLHSPIGGIGAGAAWDAGKSLANGGSIGDAVSAGLRGQAANIGGMLGSQLGGQVGAGMANSGFGAMMGANVGNFAGRSIGERIAGASQPATGASPNEALSVGLGGFGSGGGNLQRQDQPVKVPSNAPPAIQQFIDASLNAPQQMEWQPYQMYDPVAQGRLNRGL